MKKITLFLLLIFMSIPLIAQVGIGNIDPKSTLDISATSTVTPSNTDGILIPRMDDFPTTSPTADQDGMMVFATGNGTPAKGFYYWNNDVMSWVAVSGAGGGTLDEAYDFGGAGLGRVITADNGAVEIQGNGGLRVENNIIAAESIVHDADTDTFVQFTPDRIQLDAGGRNYIDIQHASQEIAFNEDSTQSDFRVESGNETHMLFVDGSEDRIGINRNNPQATLQIDGNMDGDGSAIIVNAGDTQNGVEMNLSGTSVTNIDNVDGINISHDVDFTGTGARPSGLSVTMNGSSTDAGSSVRGLHISINGPSNYLGNVYGSYIQELSTADSRLYGYFFSGGGAGVNSVYGSYNTISGAGTGAVYGNFNLMSGLGTGTKYGSYNNIGSTAGGTHYGVYSDVRKTNSFAGFFIGRVSFGTDGVLNRYIMPSIDGTAGQVITTDGAGQLSFSTLAAGVEKIDDLSDGKSDSDGSEDGSSIFLGVNAGAADDSSNNSNVGIGYESMLANTTGNLNNAIGWGSLRSNVDGSSNTAMGYLSLSGNTSGSSNTAIGMRTLNGNGTNNNNTAIGANAMYVSSGANNVAVGTQSLFSFNGSNNTAIGLSAGETTGGDNNIFIGHMAGSGSTIANNRLFIENTNAGPDNALIYGEFGTDATTTGNMLRANGEFQIGNPILTGYKFPVVDGTANQILMTNGTGQLTFTTPATGVEKIDDLADGKSDNDGSQNGSSVFLGINAGAADDSSDNKNVGVGFQVLQNNTTGQNNTAAGYGSLNSNVGGSQNTAVGLSSLNANVSGNNNTALGYQAMLANQSGFDNIAIGNGALRTNVLSAYNTSVGTQSLFSNTGASNTAFGYRALYSNGTGARNVALGLETLNANTTGNDNVAIGYRAGNTSTGSGNVFVGSEAGSGTTGNNILIVDNTNANSDNALIYGEFGADNTSTGNVLRANGELQIGNPAMASTGYALPTNRGTATSVLTSNGDGTTQWAASGGTITASNGLTKNSGNVRLGGTLLQNTTLDQDNFNFILDLSGTGDFTVQDDGSSMFQIDDSGNTNIGGMLSIRNGLSNPFTKLNLYTDTNDGVLDIINASNVVSVKFDATGDSYVNTGAFGVGTSFPNETLDVQGSDHSGFIANFTNTSTSGTGTDGVSIRLRASRAFEDNHYIAFYRSSTTLAGRIEGTVAGTGVNYQTTSDKRLKTNFAQETNALGKISDLNPLWYEYKANLGVKEFGFLAQEVQKIVPQIVSGDPNGDVEKEPMTVAYGRITPLLTAGMKELIEKVKKLESENKELKQTLSLYQNLEKRITVLENSGNLISQEILLEEK
ncbi:tail fiber domain-containing protein [Jejudonia soesokkakensis]|uniref:Tail fiber domain-containing protein n=1 Tax=Jejudonia soesokkakensis TaxID=1323432 RepID=A0ABW2MWR5_9FLAO